MLETIIVFQNRPEEYRNVEPQMKSESRYMRSSSIKSSSHGLTLEIENELIDNYMLSKSSVADKKYDPTRQQGKVKSWDDGIVLLAG